MRKKALQRFIETVDRPLSEPPAGETQAEARLRVLQDTIKRCDMHDSAGLRIQTRNGRDRARFVIGASLEAELIQARRVVRIEKFGY